MNDSLSTVRLSGKFKAELVTKLNFALECNETKGRKTKPGWYPNYHGGQSQHTPVSQFKVQSAVLVNLATITLPPSSPSYYSAFDFHLINIITPAYQQ